MDEGISVKEETDVEIKEEEEEVEVKEEEPMEIENRDTS